MATIEKEINGRKHRVETNIETPDIQWTGGASVSRLKEGRGKVRNIIDEWRSDKDE